MDSAFDHQRVRDVMTRNIVSVDAEDNVHEALELMVQNRVSALPVVDKKNHCVGIISTSDLIDLTRDVDDDLHRMGDLDPTSRKWLIDKLIHSLGDEPIAAYMSEDVASIYVESSLVKAARVMIRNRVHHLPVVDGHEHLVGIVSTIDILGAVADSSDGD